MATGSHDKKINILDASSSYKVIEVIESHQAEVRSLDFTEDGNFLVSGSEDKSVKLF